MIGITVIVERGSLGLSDLFKEIAILAVFTMGLRWGVRGIGG